MLYYFLFSLRNYFFGFNVLRYITFRSLAAFFTSLIIGIIIAPIFINLSKKIGMKQYIREDGPDKHHKKAGTPTMGGLFIIFSSIISIILWCIFNYYVFVVTLCIILFGFIGFLDDFLKIMNKNSKGITESLKLILQALFSFIIILLLDLYPAKSEIFWNFYLPFINYPLFKWIPFFGYIFYIFTMMAFSNATNLSDGLDGLAAGMGIILFIPFGIFAYVIGNYIAAQYLKFPFINGVGELSVIVTSLMGGYAAFLWYNAHPAEIFMGDTGSLSMGGTIALISIILKQEALLLIAGAMFVVETLSVVIQRTYFKITKRINGEGKRFFLMAPIHHHFEKAGWHENQIVIRFWILSGIFAIIALSTLKLR